MPIDQDGVETLTSSAEPEIVSPIGVSTAESSQRRAACSAEYQAEQERLVEFERIARLVIRARMERGLTQKQLADRVGTSHSAISRVESGQHKTSVETLQRIARAFDARLIVGFEYERAMPSGEVRREFAGS